MRAKIPTLANKFREDLCGDKINIIIRHTRAIKRAFNNVERATDQIPRARRHSSLLKQLLRMYKSIIRGMCAVLALSKSQAVNTYSVMNFCTYSTYKKTPYYTHAAAGALADDTRLHNKMKTAKRNK